ncbi:hypothetical protein [Pseudoalteromonas rubra]|uniref:hypothetical protein n=1 Tax=Pseudoalteromonas rubra TaxID=43658 RepID=UPI0013EE4608|nr:hypothetical protein [Pseudoalteromonas rubra]
MKKLSVILFMVLSNSVLAESYSVTSEITGITLGPDLVRVYVKDTSGGFESCTDRAKKVAYVLNPTELGGDIMTSALLAAKVSGQKVRFQSQGCHYGYSKITHVYFCDTDTCM